MKMKSVVLSLCMNQKMIEAEESGFEGGEFKKF